MQEDPDKPRPGGMRGSEGPLLFTSDTISYIIQRCGGSIIFDPAIIII